MQLLLFVITVIILLPLLIVGLIVFTYRIRRISLTLLSVSLMGCSIFREQDMVISNTRSSCGYF